MSSFFKRILAGMENLIPKPNQEQEIEEELFTPQKPIPRNYHRNNIMRRNDDSALPFVNETRRDDCKSILSLRTSNLWNKWLTFMWSYFTPTAQWQDRSMHQEQIRTMFERVTVTLSPQKQRISYNDKKRTALPP